LDMMGLEPNVGQVFEMTQGLFEVLGGFVGVGVQDD